VTLRSNGTVIGQGRVERTLPRFYGLDAMFDVGLDTGSPVSEDYALPFRSSALRRLTFAVDPPATSN
jgi:arylsulfatase